MENKVRDPRQNHDFTREEHRLGGLHETAVKNFSHRLRRTRCNNKCPIFDMCPMMPLSMQDMEERRYPVKTGRNKGQIHIERIYKCKMYDAPMVVKRRIKNMFLNGEEGLLNEIRNNIFLTSAGIGDDNKERMMFTDTLMRFHKTLYGEKGTQINSQEPLEITVRQLHAPGMQGQEVITRLSQKGCTGKGMKELREANAQKLLDNLKAKTEPPDADPESLYGSPILDEILSEDVKP